jgi:hypothetical protein
MAGVQQSLFKLISDIDTRMDAQLRNAEYLNKIAISKVECDMSKFMSWMRDMGEKAGGMEEAINQMKEKVRDNEQDPTSSLDPAASLQSSGSGSSWVAEGS